MSASNKQVSFSSSLLKPDSDSWMERPQKEKAVNIYVTRKSFTGKLPDKEYNDCDDDDDDEAHFFPGVDAIAHKYGMQQSPPKQNSKAGGAIMDEIKHGSMLVDRTEALIRKLNKKDQEIEKLCALLDALAPIPGLDAEKFQKLLDGSDEDGADFRDAKIVSLAKKNRRITLELQKARISAESRALQVQELSESLQKIESAAAANAITSNKTRGRAPGHENTDADGQSNDANSAEKLNAIRKDLAMAVKSVDEMRRKNEKLTEEVKTLTRTLANELGDGVSVEHAVDGGWKGRGQQIIMLKSKVKRLEQSIAMGNTANGNNDETPSQLLSARVPKGGRRAGTALNNVDNKAETELADMSNDRKQAIESIVGERDSLIKENQQMDVKLQGCKARIRNLESDLQTQKQQLKLVLNAKDGDDELIDALQLEIKRLQDAAVANARNPGNRAEAAAAVVFAGTAASATKLDQLTNEITRLKRLCKQQQEQINTQDEVIRALRNSFRN